MKIDEIFISGAFVTHIWSRDLKLLTLIVTPTRHYDVLFNVSSLSYNMTGMCAGHFHVYLKLLQGKAFKLDLTLLM